MQPARGTALLLLKEFENSDFAKALFFAFQKVVSHIAPQLSLLCGVPGIQSSSRNAHFCKAGAFLFLAACAMFAQFCHSNVHKGVGNLENLGCNRMCSMTSDFMNVSTSEV